MTYGQVLPTAVVSSGVGTTSMTDDQPVPVFTGAELALADTLILLMKVMAMHGVIEQNAINAVFADLTERYRGQKLFTPAAIADYLRHHNTVSQQQLTVT